jgi:hypothetical protein
MTCLFRLKAVECQKSNEDEDEFVLRAGGINIWEGQMVQGASVAFTDTCPVAEFRTQTRITAWEMDKGGIFGSQSDFIGDFVVPETDTPKRSQSGRLPQEGQSDYNGIYVVTYDVIPLD